MLVGGKLELIFDDETIILREGDTITFLQMFGHEAKVLMEENALLSSKW